MSWEITATILTIILGTCVFGGLWLVAHAISGLGQAREIVVRESERI